MELRHLRYFVAVAENLHFGRAAAQLGMAQPSVSHQIRQLELELQTLLLRRTKRRVQITDAGRAFLEEAREILAHADRAAIIARRAGHGEAGVLRVAMTYWIEPARILTALSRFSAEHSGVQVDLQTMSSARQFLALRDERLDVGFVRPPISEPLLASETSLREAFVVALPGAHRFAASKRVPLSALAAESFVFLRRDAVPIFYDLVLKLCRDAGFVPHAPHEVDHPKLVIGLVAAGMGVSLVPAAVRHTKPRGVVVRPLRPSPRVLHSAVAWRRDNPSPLLNAFLRIVRDLPEGTVQP